MAKPKNNTPQIGAPSIYTPELAVRICTELANGKSLRAICKLDWAPAYITVTDWIVQDREGFAAQYARARDRGLDAMADDLIEIASTTEEGETVTDDAVNGTKTVRGDMTNHRRLKVDTIKWYLSKIAPKRYGEKLEIEHKGGSLGERIRAGRKRAGQA